ncbi:alpha/beta fold hydrolase [Streptomyces sp. NPDC003038]|uniref:thioesterase II family protein n=1 Tax=unclassified Streptomyces TaxID=2593676 RepID=UPI00339F0DDE
MSGPTQEREREHGPERGRGRVPAVIRPRPVDDPELRLFVFHHAGGSHLAYTGWAEHFPTGWDVCLLEAPGRGPLSGVAPVRTAVGLAGYLLEDLAPWLDGAPFAFFGHSMGALVAYELARQLAERGMAEPVWLGVSACESPFGEDAAAGEPMHAMDSTRLRTALAAMGGLPAAVVQDDDLWALYEPRVRADFAVVESWQPRPEASARITVPLSLFGGEEDHVVDREALTGWERGADEVLGVHLYPGAHFYWDGQVPLVAEQIAQEIDTAAPGLLAW